MVKIITIGPEMAKLEQKEEISLHFFDRDSNLQNFVQPDPILHLTF